MDLDSIIDRERPRENESYERERERERERETEGEIQGNVTPPIGAFWDTNTMGIDKVRFAASLIFQFRNRACPRSCTLFMSPNRYFPAGVFKLA